MATSDRFFLGTDIGASSVKYGYGTRQAGLQYFDKVIISPKTLSALHGAYARILANVDARLGLDRIAAVGIGTCGTLDSRTGKISGVNPNLPFWVDRSPAELIPAELKLPVAWDNDANLMCLGEAWGSHPHGKVVGITVGSGIGCGYVENGKVFHGAHGYAMELGHVNAIRGGLACNCGRRGCLEAYASVDGIKRRIAALLESESSPATETAISRLLYHPNEHPAVPALIAEGQARLADAVADLIILLDPDAVIFGGGAMEGGMYDLDSLAAQIRSQLPALKRAGPAREMATQRTRAGVLGALVLASQMISPQSE